VCVCVCVSFCLSHAPILSHGGCADRFGIEDHLITNQAYVRALRFEADEFRQRYLWFWQRLRWNYLQPPSSRVPSLPAPGAASSPAPPGVKRRSGNNTGVLSGNGLHPPTVASKESLRADGGGNASGSGVVTGVAQGVSNETVQGMQGKAGEEGWAQQLLGARWTRRVFPRMVSRADSPAVDSPASSLHEPSSPPADARHAVGVPSEKSDREKGASVVMEGVNDKTEGASTRQAGGKSWLDRLRGMRHPPSDMELHDAPASEAVTQVSPSAQSAPGPTSASPESVAKSGGKPSLRPDGSTTLCASVPSALREAGGACPPAPAAADCAKTPDPRFTLPRSRL
jgi:hypothetical protein